MSDSRIELFDKAVKLRKESTKAFADNWLDYSLYTTFEFWLLVLLFFVPLIVVIWKIDKGKIFVIGFYGYSVHLFGHYLNLIGINTGVWNYPISLIPLIPSASFDACVVPVTYMLVYQWILNKKKNYYIYIFITAMLFAFVCDPISVKLGLLKMYGNVNYLYSIGFYLSIALIAKIITNVFVKLSNKKILNN